jgi:transposase-like protein
MTKRSRTFIRYSISFKQKVVKEIEEEGLGLMEAKRRYGVGGAATINTWLKEFGKSHLLNKIIRVEMKDEKDRLRELEKENQKLKIALAEAYLARDCAEKVIEVAGEIYQTDLKKKFGEKASPGSGKVTG